MIKITEITPIKLSGLSSLFVEFPFNQEIINFIKTLSPAVFHKKLTGWEVASYYLSRLLDTLTYYDEITLTLKPENEIKEISLSPLTENEIISFKERPFGHQVEGINFLLKQGKSLLLDSMGVGKEEPVDSLIPTPNGFVRMGDITPGSYVFGIDGKPHEVLRVYPHKNKDIYKVTFSDGTERLCGEEHLWRVRTPVMRTRKKGWTVKSTREIIEAGIHYDNYPTHNKWEIPMCSPVEYQEKEYFIHPYILGVLLGDGCLTKGTPCISIPNSDPDTPDRIRGYLQPNYRLTKIMRQDEGCSQYNISHILNVKGSSHSYKNEYMLEVERLGINAYSGEKFIPEEYKLGSVQQRLDLLRGLMDTDGSISPTKNKISFSSTSKQLAEDLAEIARSLGMVAKVNYYTRIRERKAGTFEEAYYIVRLNPNVNPFYLERKAARYTKTTTKYLSRYISNIELVGKSDTQCITVDVPDHCYLTGREYIVTHNTLELIYYAETLKSRGLIDHCLIICGVNSVKLNFAKEIKRFSKESVRVLGQRVSKNGKVSYAKLSERAEELKNSIDEFFVITNIETLRSDAIIEAFNKSVNKFGLICVDEGHRALGGNISNSQASNLRKLKSTFKVVATGTLITNNPLSAYGPLVWTENDHATLTNYKSQYCNFGGFNNSQVIGYHNLSFLQEELDHCSIRRTFDMIKSDMPTKTIEFELVEMSDEHREFYEAIKEGVKEEADKVELKTNNLLALTTRLRQATAAPSVLTSQAISSSKVDRCVELVEELVSQGEKVVVLSNFVDPVYRLAEKLSTYDPLVNTGDIDDSVVSANVDKFQTDPSAKIFLGTHSKVGTGLSLPAAHYMLMIDTPWTYSQFSQSCDRIYRITSNQNVYIKVLACANTIDERVIEIIENKKELSDYLVDGVENSKFADELRDIITNL